jgi:hypothetical protein
VAFDVLARSFFRKEEKEQKEREERWALMRGLAKRAAQRQHFRRAPRREAAPERRRMVGAGYEIVHGERLRRAPA